MNIIYRGSVDGFKISDFHKKCDGEGATLSVIKTTCGEILGGFTKVPWAQYGEYKSDADAYLFSVNHE